MTDRKYSYFTIFGTMRSGSNLLEQSLNQYPDIHCYGELFNPSFISGPNKNDFLGFSLIDREKDPISLIDAMISSNKGGIAGFRIFYDHDQRVVDKTLLDPQCAKIVLQRDPLNSFLSLKIAQNTDQWMLRNISDRRTAQIVFDPNEFEEYRKVQDAYYTHVRTVIQETGQSAFWLNYPEQKDPNIVNGLAKFLGSTHKVKSLKEKIRRQNPEPLHEKIQNYSDVEEYLKTISKSDETAPPDLNRKANIPRMVSCISQPILFAPIPGGPNEEVLRWMNAVDNGCEQCDDFSKAVQDGDILHTGHSQRTLLEWMQSNPGLVTMTAVQHPVVRAYDVFMSKIFATTEDSYKIIREKLIAHFDMVLPDGDIKPDTDIETLADYDYTMREHRAAFHQFLRFLRMNLDKQTGIRIDGLWARQMSFLQGFTTTVPITNVAFAGKLDGCFRYIEDTLDIKVPALGSPILPKYSFDLADVYTRQTENLTRRAYNSDYKLFGFDDYHAALEA